MGNKISNNSNGIEIKQCRCHDATITETHLFYRLHFGKPRSFVTKGFPQIYSLIQLNTHLLRVLGTIQRIAQSKKEGGLESKQKCKCRCNNTACETTIEAVSMAEMGERWGTMGEDRRK